MIYALVDFGSTFTKVALVERDTGVLIAAAQHPTTIDTDVFEGYNVALAHALHDAGIGAVDHVLAASSAAGGLRMVAIGLVDDLTASAARRAALSGGAKVEGVWSGRLDDSAAQQISSVSPDLILFAGGTDGGDRERVLHNARCVAEGAVEAAVVVACNSQVAGEAAAIFEHTGHHVVIVDNVLPRIDVENATPAREAIREVFIERVVRAKGLSTTSAFFDSVLMPTPAAVLACAELIARPPEGLAGAGSAIIIDVGGATTDLHSVLPQAPPRRRTRRSGPAPAPSARTVEGDLGVRWNADAVYSQDARWITGYVGLDATEIERAIKARKATPSYVPDSDAQRRIDRALAASCIAGGVARHVGRLATHYVPGEGADVVLTGRDLRDSRVVLATGGSLVRDADAGANVVETALERLDSSRPVPRSAALLVDHHYVLAAAGLLSTQDPAAAHRLLTREVPGLAAALTTTAQ